MITRLEYLASADVLLSREVVRLKPYLQLLFIRLFLMTDGAGRFKADVVEIRTGLCAHELQQVSERDVASRLQELHRAGLIKLYTAGHVGFGKVADRFWRQRDLNRKVLHPDEPSEPGLPGFDPPPDPGPDRSEVNRRKGKGTRAPRAATPPLPAAFPDAAAQHDAAMPVEDDAAWLTRLIAKYADIDVPAQLEKAHRKRRGDVERGWFEDVWLPCVTPKAPRGTAPKPPSAAPVDQVAAEREMAATRAKFAAMPEPEKGTLDHALWLEARKSA